MTTRHGITHAEQLFVGDAYYAPYAGLSDGRRGLRFPQLFVKEFGAVTTADTDGVVDGATATGAATLSATGVLVSGGVATFDVPRAVSLTSTGNNSSVTYTVTGTDEYGETLTEAITGPNNTTVVGAKAFKTVTSVASSAAVVGTMDVGTSAKLGFPIAVADVGKVIAVSVDGKPETTLTVVPSATTAATATTGDVRGTFLPNTAPNGTRRYTVTLVVGDNRTKEGAFGVTPA